MVTSEISTSFRQPNIVAGVEQIECNQCGADNTSVIFRVPTPVQYGLQFGRDDWNIVRCRQCGLVYVNPRVDAETLRTFYSFDNSSDRSFVQAWFMDGADLQRATWRRFVRTLQRFCPKGRLLDVGCGAGSFLVEAQRAGYEVAGQEVSPYFLDRLRSQFSIPIYSGDIENMAVSEASFDCVTAFDVIEHHPNPKQLLNEIHRLLHPGGIAMISTHDIGNAFARLYRMHWRHIHPIGHLTYFTRQTLTKMMESCGFRVIHGGGLRTIDADWQRTALNWLTQPFKTILLRALILGTYKPLATRIPALTRWQVRLGGALMNHEQLMLRTGGQLIINDDIVLLAVAE